MTTSCSLKSHFIWHFGAHQKSATECWLGRHPAHFSQRLNVSGGIWGTRGSPRENWDGFPQLKASDPTQTISGCSWLTLELHDGDNDPGQDWGSGLLQENRWMNCIHFCHVFQFKALSSVSHLHLHTCWWRQLTTAVPLTFFRMCFGPCDQWGRIVIRF